MADQAMKHTKYIASLLAAVEIGNMETIPQLLQQPVECGFCNAVVRPIDGVAGSNAKSIACPKCRKLWWEDRTWDNGLRQHPREDLKSLEIPGTACLEKPFWVSLSVW